MTSPGTEPARPALRGRQADSARRRACVIQAISAATAAGREISPSSIARAADVDRTFLYRHRDLLEQVHAIQATPPGEGTGPAASSASLQADLLNAQQRATRLAARVQQLEHRLSALLGDHAWQEPGLGAPPGIDALKQHTLMQQVREMSCRILVISSWDGTASARAHWSIPDAASTRSLWLTQRAIADMVTRYGDHVVNVSATLAEVANSSAPAVLAVLTRGGLAAAIRLAVHGDADTATAINIQGALQDALMTVPLLMLIAPLVGAGGSTASRWCFRPSWWSRSGRGPAGRVRHHRW